MAPSSDWASEVESTRRVAASAEDHQAVVVNFRHWYAAGNLSAIWDERCRYGVSVDPGDMRSTDWFWFNAYAALAGLKLRKLPGFPLDNFCGLADRAATDSDPEQAEAKDEIHRLYFGH